MKMNCLQEIDTTNSFLNEEIKKNEIQNDSLFVRFIRKKYKCIILWLLSIIAFSQLLVIIFEKVDENLLKKITKLLDYQNHTTKTNKTSE